MQITYQGIDFECEVIAEDEISIKSSEDISQVLQASAFNNICTMALDKYNEIIREGGEK